MVKDVFLAQKAGFCMGVSLAIKKLNKALSQYATKQAIYTFGPIIHNPQVLAYYQQKGVKIANSVEDCPEESIVLIRAHGVPVAVEQKLKSKSIRIIDATCPKVKKAQVLIEKYSKSRTLLLFGEKQHPEVKGLVSYAKGKVFIFENLSHLKQLDLKDKEDYVLVAQTTQNQQEFLAIQSYLKAAKYNVLTLETICQATEERQQGAINLAKKVDFMVVVGGKISGNTRRLAQIVAQYVPHIHIETADELSPQIVSGYSKIGVTAGASTPKNIINQVIERIKILA
ncbi:MAG: 4-hydroxy-3-methylbut-2-enyl diphosphate reductase [Desulfonauticus sp.]|nr:4-hydroxy-3-methylbut-2-enyl diphosphate reductase [Desulfonauticus sp.]